MKNKLHKPTTKQVLLFLTVALAILISREIFLGQIAFGLFVAGSFCTNPILIAIIYLVGGVLNSAISGVWQTLLIRVVQVGIILIAFFIHKKVKRQISKPLLILYMVLANIIFCVLGYAGASWLVDRLVAMFVGIATAFITIFTLKAVFTRGLVYKPTFDEIICIALFGIIVSYSLATFDFFIYNLLMFVAPFVILFLLTSFGDVSGLIGAIVFSLAGLFASSNFSLFAVYVTMSLCALTFNKLNRYAAGVSIIICDTLMAYFFNVYGVFDFLILIPTVVSVVLFFVLPKRVTQSLANLYGSRVEYAGKSIVNKLRNNLAYKLYGLSDVFFSMKSTFVSLTGDKVNKTDAQHAIIRQVSQSVCGDCKNKSSCWRTNLAKTESCFLDLTECALSSGKVTILDVNGALNINCDRLGALLSAINTQAETYIAFMERTTEVENNRLLIGEQLGGVSQIMHQLANDCKGNLKFNTAKEKEIVESLTFHNILTSEAVFIEETGGVMVILTVAKKDLDSVAICAVVGKVLGNKMRVDKIEQSENDSWMTVYISYEARYQLTYGIKNAVKHGSEVSGDTHSFTKIVGNKFMIAICDGMGSGEKAENMSNTAISLVENFYRAGFDSEVILNCTNKLLASFNSETFTAVDICVVDLNNGLCDFIKLGASDGLIKNADTVKFVAGSSLPLGVLSEMKPSITKCVVKSGDFVLLCSDGFWECFAEPNELASMLHNTTLTNPQTIADSFMNVAMKNCKLKPTDDMTVVVARVV